MLIFHTVSVDSRIGLRFDDLLAQILLQHDRCQQLLRQQKALQQGHVNQHRGQTVHPGGNALPAEHLRQRIAEMIAVPVQKMVLVALEIVSDLSDDRFDFALAEIGVAQRYGLPERARRGKRTLISLEDLIGEVLHRVAQSITYLNLKFSSPSAISLRGSISNTPEKGNE